MIDVDLDAALIEKEPITIVLSDKGWMRALKGHVDDLGKLEFKQGDKLKRAVKAYDHRQALLLATNGKIFTLEASLLPGGRGQGEPVRLMIDLEENHDIADAFVHQPGRKLLIASTGGYGFVVPEDEVVASTRKGKQVLNVSEPEEAKLIVPVDGDHVAMLGDNRKMLVFKLDEVNEMTRGKGVILQRFKDGHLADARVFKKADGLTWLDSAGRTFTLSWAELRDWVGVRAQVRAARAQGLPALQQLRPGVLADEKVKP